MKKRITIEKAFIKENELILEGKFPVALAELSAVGRILVDSDQLAFIYLTEMNNEYTYIELPEEIWPEIKKALDAEYPVYAAGGGERLLLDQFHNELSYLIENIKGNSNYGAVMVEKVENVF
ncbi:hypothetical protein CVD25_09530 [Bacillus canaveralius]|uniref:Uncharacterized protein n=1 Tax=Bacillus canaveralius TaxID=1403243 RepID=A0A2N5GKJ5_9BACI|nr:MULTISPECIES: hypothetical protein [Bacillus]PLR81816.1 hypothetical protein CVD23_17885 [Bacillus sp. V33-4]PLR82045.1 hypothetical protein CU635_12810 [Bacillus canaveralius]PLR98049.1 hypothetical protein CVD25_09530 [Bacillus canaveralius]